MENDEQKEKNECTYKTPTAYMITDWETVTLTLTLSETTRLLDPHNESWVSWHWDRLKNEGSLQAFACKICAPVSKNILWL